MTILPHEFVQDSQHALHEVGAALHRRVRRWWDLKRQGVDEDPADIVRAIRDTASVLKKIAAAIDAEASKAASKQDGSNP